MNNLNFEFFASIIGIFSIIVPVCIYFIKTHLSINSSLLESKNTNKLILKKIEGMEKDIEEKLNNIGDKFNDLKIEYTKIKEKLEDLKDFLKP